ncbi:MAG: hypothetical protein ABI900_12485 [Betaproteobacteria bacterium]
MKGRLNLFQAAMVRWREMHPYNAVHVVTLPLTLDLSRLQACIDRQLEGLGLTGLTLDRRRLRYEWTGGAAAAPVTAIVPGADAQATVRAEIERQLNLAFPAAGRIEPFRFFVVDTGPAFHFGLAYDHFIAGGDSIVRLLQRMVEDYCGIAPGGATLLPDLYPPGYRRLFARQALALARGLSSWRYLVASCRRSARPPYPKDGDGYNGVAFGRLEAAESAQLSGTARAWGMTRNDLFLTIMLMTLSPQVPERRQAKRRRELAVGSIVNVRSDFGPRSAEGFVPLLGSFRVSHPVPDGMPLRELARFVGSETGRIKQRKLYLQTLLAIGLSSLQWRHLSNEERQRFHAKNYAVWAGVTPLQLNALWPEAKVYPFRLGYIRAVSTGPLSPVVVALTTLGDVVEVALSFRRGALDRHRAERLLADIIHSIRSLAP